MDIWFDISKYFDEATLLNFAFVNKKWFAIFDIIKNKLMDKFLIIWNKPGYYKGYYNGYACSDHCTNYFTHVKNHKNDTIYYKNNWLSILNMLISEKRFISFKLFASDKDILSNFVNNMYIHAESISLIETLFSNIFLSKVDINVKIVCVKILLDNGVNKLIISSFSIVNALNVHLIKIKNDDYTKLQELYDVIIKSSIKHDSPLCTKYAHLMIYKLFRRHLFKYITLYQDTLKNNKADKYACFRDLNTDYLLKYLNHFKFKFHSIRSILLFINYLETTSQIQKYSINKKDIITSILNYYIDKNVREKSSKTPFITKNEKHKQENLQELTNLFKELELF